MSTQHEDKHEDQDQNQERIYNQIIANIKILERFINTKCFFNLDKIERTINELILLRRHCELKHCQEIDFTFYKISKILNKEQLDRIFKKIFQYKKDVLKDKLLFPILEKPLPPFQNQNKTADEKLVESIENLKRQRERTEKNRMTRRTQGYLNSKKAIQNRREQQKRKDQTQREKRIAQRKQQQQPQQPQQQLQEKKASLLERIFRKKGGSLRKNIKHHNKTSRRRNKQTRRRRQK